jgi:nucleoside-diphosphate-sugar epimerase
MTGQAATNLSTSAGEGLRGTALVVGSTGITGLNLAAHLAQNNWRVYGLARNPRPLQGVQPVAADLMEVSSLEKALDGLPITHVFFGSWLRQNTEAENIRVNGGMFRNLFSALKNTKTLTHTALVTGTKHYLGPFEAYGKTSAETPFREDSRRLPIENFYYTQEDILFEESKRRGFTWSVHRAHSMIGYALGNAMNMGVTLAVYGTICRETKEPFVFPGSQVQWNALTDVTDAMLLAKHLEWAALTTQAHNHPFNVVNGDIFRWRWLWPKLAAYFGVQPVGPSEKPQPLEQKMTNAGGIWKEIAAKYKLAEAQIDKLASWWHTDGDLGRELECVNDMTNSRQLGFCVYQPTVDSFFNLFELLKKDHIIPA